MGTNYYFFTRNKQLAKEYFPYYRTSNDRFCEGAVLTDEPDFGYEIHLCKLSCGWVPLFEVQKAFSTFVELQNFFAAHSSDLRVIDEYGEELTFGEFKELIIAHASRSEREAMKWDFGIDPIDKHFISRLSTPTPRLHLRKCEDGEEPDITTPFRHDEYAEKEREARRKFRVEFGFGDDIKYYKDPLFAIDWTEGSFS